MRGYLPKSRTGLAYFPRVSYRRLWNQWKNYFFKSRRRAASLPRQFYTQVLLSYIGSFIGISALSYLSVATHAPLIMAPFGATSVLAFAVPDSPLAQPRNIIGGNLLAALVSLICVHLFGAEPWVMAIAVATAIALMQMTKTLHPPSGAVALVVVMTHAPWHFLLTPVLVGSLILVFCTVVFNNLAPGRNYPKQWL